MVYLGFAEACHLRRHTHQFHFWYLKKKMFKLIVQKGKIVDNNRYLKSTL